MKIRVAFRDRHWHIARWHRGDLWNFTQRLLYTAERSNDAVLSKECLFNCDHPQWSTTFAKRSRYHRVNFSREKELLSRRVRFRGHVTDGSSWMCIMQRQRTETRTLEPGIGTEDRGKAALAVVAMQGDEYGAEDTQNLFEALCKGINAPTHDATLQIP